MDSNINLRKAAQEISELDLKILVDNALINIIACKVYINEGSWNLRRHMHSSYEFHFIMDGTCRVELDDGEFKAKAGEFYLTAPKINHEQKSEDNNRFVEYGLNCDIEMTPNDNKTEFQQIIEIFKETPCKPFKDRHVIELFNNIFIEISKKEVGYYNNIKSSIYLLLSASARIMGDYPAGKYSLPICHNIDDYRFKRIEKYIKDNIYNVISTKDISQHMFLSDKQICRIIKKVKGTTTKELILNMKLDKAKKLLNETDYTIKWIADYLGFTNEYYFNYFFKKREGQPPAFYRKFSL